MADKKNVIINSVPVDLAEIFSKKAESAGKTKTELFCEMVYNYNVNEDVFTLAEAEAILKEKKEKETPKLGFDDDKPYTGVPVFKK